MFPRIYPPPRLIALSLYSSDLICLYFFIYLHPLSTPGGTGMVSYGSNETNQRTRTFDSLSGEQGSEQIEWHADANAVPVALYHHQPFHFTLAWTCTHLIVWTIQPQPQSGMSVGRGTKWDGMAWDGINMLDMLDTLNMLDMLDILNMLDIGTYRFSHGQSSRGRPQQNRDGCCGGTKCKTKEIDGNIE